MSDPGVRVLAGRQPGSWRALPIRTAIDASPAPSRAATLGSRRNVVRLLLRSRGLTPPTLLPVRLAAHRNLVLPSTVHAFQGRTVDNVIVAMEARHPHLNMQKSFDVEVSRARPRRARHRRRGRAPRPASGRQRLAHRRARRHRRARPAGTADRDNVPRDLVWCPGDI